MKKWRKAPVYPAVFAGFFLPARFLFPHPIPQINVQRC